MGKHDKIISYQDWCQLREHVHNSDRLAQKSYISWEDWQNYIADNDRCIKILEDCKDV